ncbi:exosortase O [Aerosakkonemataceae cyanobacterium BLCC-F154]|uniref:Exosortase O n=1 Tax=Floridaenema fluviatile BLCC-F154 TaxID=3153640 RepID=A0ABV4Y710_9CYAN
MISEDKLVRFETKQGVNWAILGGSCLVILSWLYLNLSSLQWLAQTLPKAAPFSLMLVALGGLLLIIQGLRYFEKLNFSAVPVLHTLPLIVMMGSAIGAIAIPHFLEIEQLPILLFILGTYGLIGLFLNPENWRKGLPLAFAIACLLPFSIQFTTGLGFPMRLLTAHAVERILAHWHIAAISSEDIILLENGIAHVDLPCSGMKSLWVGTLFLLAATWLENRRIGLHWLLVCVANFVLLILANIARVLTLVVTTYTFGQSELAHLLHIPLGIFAFTTTCLLTWGLLRGVPLRGRGAEGQRGRGAFSFSLDASHRNPYLVQIVLIVCILGLTFVPQSHLKAAPLALTNVQASLSFPIQSVPLKSVEEEFFADYPGAIAQKLRFDFNGISGTILLVSSTTRQAQHAPELCLAGMGFQVNSMEKRQFTSDITGRWLSLNQGNHKAVYWFQSSQRTTDDFVSRIWGEVTRRELSWVMISVLFDRSYQPDNPEVVTFLTEVHQAIADKFQGAML